MNIRSGTIKSIALLTACALAGCGGSGKPRRPSAEANSPTAPGGGTQPVPAPPTPPAPAPPPPTPAPPTSPPPANPPPAPCGKVVFRDGFWTGTINVDRQRPDLNDYTWTGMNLDRPDKSTATVLPDPAGSAEGVRGCGHDAGS